MNTFTLSVDLQQVLTTEQAWHYGVIPSGIEGEKISFIIDEQQWTHGIEEELELLLGKQIHLEKKSSDLVRQLLGKYYLRDVAKVAGNNSSRSLSAKQGDDFLPSLIAEAKQLRSSDIHIETFEDRARVRIRIDGLLVERYVIPKNDYPALINKIKIQANLDIAEKRLPQDGRIFFRDEAMKFDIRVSVLPTLHGEKVVLRLLSNDATNIDLNTLGFSDDQLRDYLDGVRKPHGILLISGPTGSGKTTTLYATLKLLNKETTNIVTVEDPIEYTLEGINQVQLKESIGLSFASALRTFLRQDPDIIMLGEIRDGETAQMAVRAALTGHLVLSTIHTNSAWGTISRLADMGVPPFLIANTINTSVAQRLVRLLCPHCKKQVAFRREMLPRNFNVTMVPEFIGTPVGCGQCFYTGYRGRKAIYEIVPIDHEFSDCIKSLKDYPGELYKSRNISTLSQSAFRLLESGETSIDEVYSILSNTFN